MSVSGEEGRLAEVPGTAMKSAAVSVRREGAGLAGILGAAVPRVCSAAVAAIAVGGVTVAAAAVGENVRYSSASEQLAADRPPARRDSIFDLASVTKLFTTAVILSLVEEGRLGLDEPVAAWLPACYGGAPEVTLRHLLTHTAGLPPGRRAHEEIPGSGPKVHARRMARILSTSPIGPAGGRYLYSDVGLITAGRVAEIAGRAPLDELARARITGPLGLSDTGYRPAASLLPRIVATEHKPERPGPGCVRGEVHDETAHGLGGVAGHAGIFSTADDLLRFAETLRTGGAPMLRPATVAEITRDHGVEGTDFRHGLGVRIGDPAIVGPLADAYGHSGFTGTSLVVDPGRALAVVLLTNNVHPLRGRAGIRDLRNAVAIEALRLS
ncbi:beta-lactamase family protein [Streptosporangium sp. NBC_01755]|uniref:serine hydrolase domain-containing protein n=1 Tax=unclassified Streptosporangium TaxID=2632669 RepID=UPI002DD94753|nr:MULTISPECIES: serine hydrolase domain-containing protein [unclassified Streptosporangium]WSA28442.1 beta-lactamase family protein [Streptosporangium sp. NBC_01810]WSD00068.1 beta-lactamase family protein [Streptosporangium sp. NBC_01755]